MDNGNEESSTFDVEDIRRRRAMHTGCWCSESSVWSMLWDATTTTPTPMTTWRWAFSRLWNVLIDSQRTTPAFTSLFSFISRAEGGESWQIAAIDTLVAAQNTTAIADIWGYG